MFFCFILLYETQLRALCQHIFTFSSLRVLGNWGRASPKVEPIRNPTLFQMEKLEEVGKPANTLTVDRPFSLPGILLGTSAFTATGWEGSFYPRGMQPRDFLSYYATQFATVEVDSTFYGCPSPRTVNNWAARTPEGFIFSVKVPQVITHEKVLVDCDSEIEEQTKTWDKVIVDRREDLTNWVELFRKFVTRNLKIFAYANNHYAGHGPATVKQFCQIWSKS